jgi:hypothetical protein
MRLPAFRFPSFFLTYFVIASASEAIQLLYRAALDCFVAFASRNDDRNRWLFDMAACQSSDADAPRERVSYGVIAGLDPAIHAARKLVQTFRC